jgi:site-specific DNA-methyltransferase (adenine-specific)
MEHFKTTTLIHGDCHELLKTFKDKEFDLAIVDPPYGIGEDGKSNDSRGKFFEKRYIGSTKFTHNSWDSAPFPRSFFAELFRVSKHWVLWGAQHYADNIPYPHKASCYIQWDKDVSADFADFECAWTNFNTANRKFKYAWNGFSQGISGRSHPHLKEKRVHPTQKPIALYEWLLAKYAKPGMRILDPTAGAGACGIACIRAGLECTLIEQDDEYCGFIRNRLSGEILKPTLFETAELQAQIWGK